MPLDGAQVCFFEIYSRKYRMIRTMIGGTRHLASRTCMFFYYKYSISSKYIYIYIYIYSSARCRAQACTPPGHFARFQIRANNGVYRLVVLCAAVACLALPSTPPSPTGWQVVRMTGLSKSGTLRTANASRPCPASRACTFFFSKFVLLQVCFGLSAFSC